MTDDSLIHYWPSDTDVAPCKVNLAQTPYTFGSDAWPDVTCLSCKASRFSPSLAEVQTRRAWQIEQAQAAANEALRQTTEWTRVLRDANRVLDRLYKSLSDFNGAVGGEGGSETSTPQIRAQGPHGVRMDSEGSLCGCGEYHVCKRLYPGPS